MLSSNQGRRARLSVECLEGRFTPAGGVLAVQQGGLLTLTGDREANYVTVAVTPTGGVTVTGINTKVSVSRPVFTGVQSIRANLGTGADAISITGSGPGVRLAAVSVNGGSEVDTLNVSNLTVAGRLDVVGGSGADVVRITNVLAEGKAANGAVGVGMNLDLGSENDLLYLTVPAGGRQVAQVHIAGGAGSDLVSISGAGAGNSRLSSLVVEGGADDDRLQITSIRVDVGVYRGGTGVDRIQLFGDTRLDKFTLTSVVA